MSNELRCGLYIDLLMTVRYSHEAWEGHVCSANSHEAWKGRVCSWRTDTVASAGEDASVQRYPMQKNDSVLMPKGELKLALNPNPARREAAAAHVRVW